MICITGAGGTVGSEVLNQLKLTNSRFRVAYFSAGKADRARSDGMDAAVIDYNQPDTLEAAFASCDSLFLLGPNDLNQTELELNAVEAAKCAGVQHIVKHSVLGADGESYSLAHVHRPVEKAIEASGLAWTFLRPNSFMQNVETFMSESIRAEGAFYSASGDAKISHVDVRDIAAVAVQALTDGAHEGKTYTLTGPDALSYDEIAAALSAATGRAIAHVSLPPADLKGAMLGSGMPEPLADRMLDLERYFREDCASSISEAIKLVTGNHPRSFRDYVREIAGTGVLDADT